MNLLVLEKIYIESKKKLFAKTLSYGGWALLLLFNKIKSYMMHNGSSLKYQDVCCINLIE